MNQIKDPNFVKDCSKLVFARANVNQFESDWVALFEEYHLTDSAWMKDLWESCEI